MSTLKPTPITQSISFNTEHLYDSIITNNFILCQNNISQNKFQLKYLNLLQKQWKNIKFGTDKYDQHISLIALLFPYSAGFAAVRVFNSTAYLYIINHKWDVNNNPIGALCKFVINLVTNTLFESTQLPTTINNTYHEIYDIKCTSNKCHIFAYEHFHLQNHSEAKICHSIINDLTNKHEILDVITWIPYTNGGWHRVILDNDTKSFYMQQIAFTNIRGNFQSTFTFSKYTQNIWSEIPSMTHLIAHDNEDRNINQKHTDSTSLFINNIRIHFDFESKKIWLQDFNSNKVVYKYTLTSYELPHSGYYEIWFSHENKQIESIIINGFTRKITSASSFIHFPPQYLMDIILHFFHFPQINFMLRELWESPWDHSDLESCCQKKLDHVGQYCSINSSDLLLHSIEID